YTLTFGLVPVLAGRLGDDHGRRLMFQIGVGGFVVTSALSGLAPSGGILIAARVLQGGFGGLINPQVSGLVQLMFRGHERGRAFGVIGTIVGVATALGPVVGGILIALGGPHFGWRLVFFVNIPVGIAVIALARRWLPDDRSPGHHRLDVVGALLLGLATWCVLFGAVEYDEFHDPRLLALAVPAIVLARLFLRRERALTRAERDPLVDIRLFREPSYTAGVVLALFFFPAMAGLPFVLALYYQRGLGYTALQSALGVTAYAVGSAMAAPLAGRFVVAVGRRLIVWSVLTFGIGAVALAVVAAQHPGPRAALWMAVPLFVMGCGQGGVVTPNQALSLMEVDPIGGSTAGGVLQTAQRIGLAIGQAVIGAAFFLALPLTSPRGGPALAGAYGHSLTVAVLVALCFLAAALVVGVHDLARTRRRKTGGGPT
ncbi:MAG: MFS transporter, partial [Nocardioidaceae bacterium]